MASDSSPDADQPSAAQLLAARDWPRIRALRPEAAARFVSDACDQFAAALDRGPDGTLDSELIVRVGLALKRVPDGAAVEAALAWCERAASPARLRVLGLVLTGLWVSPAECSDDQAARLLGARGGLALDDDGEYWFASAVMVAATCGGSLAPDSLVRLRTAFHDALDRVPADKAARLRPALPRP